MCIVGPSGCGKSTLLRSIAGLHPPHRRRDPLRGRPGRADARQPRRGLPGLQPLAVPLDVGGRQRRPAAAPQGHGPAAAAGRRRWTRWSRSAWRAPGGKYPWELSGGMQQRVSIARALAYRPALMLMDEPFGSVDAQTREDLEDLVLRVRGAARMTILLITHDIDESVYVGDRVVVLSKAPAQGRRRPAGPAARPPRPDHHPRAPGLRPAARRGRPPGQGTARQPALAG